MSGKGLPSLGAIALLAALLVVLFTGEDEVDRATTTPPGAQPSAEAREGPTVPVLEIVDGDTVRVEYEGEEESVRYIGVDTPEVDPNIGVECFGDDASEFNRDLVEGRDVRLVFDAEQRDRYGRLLAYIYRRPDNLFVNEELIREGYARTLTIAPNDSFADHLDRLEQAAANAGRGLWGEC